MSNLSAMFATANVAIPDEGPKVIRADLDFSALDNIDIEGLLATTTGFMSYVQGVFIDNQTNPNPVELKCSVTGQIITCPATSQGYFPLLITNPPRFNASTTPAADLRVLMFFYNVPIQPMVWGPDGIIVSTGGLTNAELRATPVPVSGPLTDAQLRATAVPVSGPLTLAQLIGAEPLGVSGPLTDAQLRATAIPVTPTQPIGGAYTDRSIANLSGASENLMAANANRRVLVVSNESVTPIALNLTGGVAALNTAGSITIAAGGSITLDTFPPTALIKIIGTLNADVTAYEG